MLTHNHYRRLYPHVVHIKALVWAITIRHFLLKDSQVLEKLTCLLWESILLILLSSVPFALIAQYLTEYYKHTQKHSQEHSTRMFTDKIKHYRFNWRSCLALPCSIHLSPLRGSHSPEVGLFLSYAWSYIFTICMCFHKWYEVMFWNFIYVNYVHKYKYFHDTV